MSGFKRKPMPDELTEALRGHASNLPSVTPLQPQPAIGNREGEGRGVRKKALPTCQVNFNCTHEMARIIAQEAAKVGSTRRFFARLMRGANFDVPEDDVTPLDNRRRWG